MNKNKISQILEISGEFLFIDEVISIVPGVSAEAIASFDVQQPYFRNHLFNDPVLPATIMTESALQAFMLPIYAAEPNPWQKKGVIFAFNTKVYRPIRITKQRAESSDGLLALKAKVKVKINKTDKGVSQGKAVLYQGKNRIAQIFMTHIQ